MHFSLRAALPPTFIVLTASVASCSAKGAVSLAGSLGNASITVDDGPLVTTLSGSFDVYLELGERASDATHVTFPAFSLVRADTGLPALAQEHLSVVASKQAPIRVQPGSNTTVSFQIGDQAPGGSASPMELAKDDYATICGAGPLKIVGTLQHSLDGQRSMPLSSGSFSPSGC